ncbi:unnamed protein product, partial [Meganyctiphanes norvegica]
NGSYNNMNFRCIIVITFVCLFSLLESINAIQDENATIKSNLEIHTSDKLRRIDIAKSPRNCLDLKKQWKKTGAYMITPCDDRPTKVVKVYCDMDTDGGGWTVIQRRDNYTQQEDFYTNWYEYAIGFGDVSQDFWLGNDNIHCLTQQGHHEIHIDLEDFDRNTRHANYEFFYIDDRSNHYRLSVLGYSGDAGDSFSRHDNMKFTTKDRDNDLYGSNCAVNFKGAWWYKDCHDSNLNGLYLSGNHSTHANGVNWRHWKGHNYSLKKTEMKIREKI